MANLRILDFDIENRPLAYMGDDYTSGEITAIAACWGLGERVHVWLLGRNDPVVMLRGFKKLYDHADIVTGHYIRKHDLPVINAAMLEYKLPPLGPKLACDTKLDATETKYLSMSQENLAITLGVASSKAHLANATWREANRLTPEGLKETTRRVVGDVRQHMELRLRMAELGYLKAPRVWTP